MRPSPRGVSPDPSGLTPRGGRVIVPYTQLHPRCSLGLERFAPHAELVHLDPADTSAYWRLFADLWAGQGDLVIVEHDIEIHSGVLPGFGRCDRGWCTYPYRGPAGSWLEVSLGCVRFTEALRRQLPDLPARCVRTDSAEFSDTDYRRLDVRVVSTLIQAVGIVGQMLGASAHVHSPPVRHHHVYRAADGTEACACGTHHRGDPHA